MAATTAREQIEKAEARVRRLKARVHLRTAIAFLNENDDVSAVLEINGAIKALALPKEEQ